MGESLGSVYQLILKEVVVVNGVIGTHRGLLSSLAATTLMRVITFEVPSWRSWERWAASPAS